MPLVQIQRKSNFQLIHWTAGIDFQASFEGQLGTKKTHKKHARSAPSLGWRAACSAGAGGRTQSGVQRSMPPHLSRKRACTTLKGIYGVRRAKMKVESAVLRVSSWSTAQTLQQRDSTLLMGVLREMPRSFPDNFNKIVVVVDTTSDTSCRT